MYQEKDLRSLYDRLKAQHPEYDLAFSGDSLTVTRLHANVEVDWQGAKLYVNDALYDQFTSREVDDPDDVYELLELFFLDVQHAGMQQGNETYRTARRKAARWSTLVLLLVGGLMAACLAAAVVTGNRWWMVPVFALPLASLVPLAMVRSAAFRQAWVCPACGRPLPLRKSWLTRQMAYVPQCPHCRRVLEQAPDLEPIQLAHRPSDKPPETAQELPAPGSKWPSRVAGGIAAAAALVLLPLIFVPDGGEPLDPVGVGIGVVLLLVLLGFGLLLLLCRTAPPAETRRPVVVVREGVLVTVLGMIVWGVGFVLLLMGVLVAGTPPFEGAVTAFVAVPGLLLSLLGVWMLLAGRNRSLFVFRDRSMVYTSSWGRPRELAPGQVSSVRLTATHAIHLLDREGKKLAAVETNMRGIPQLVQWIEQAGLGATVTPAMEKQAKKEAQAEQTVQWREEYRTRWHDHIRAIRVGLWVVVLLFAAGVAAPLPLFFYAGVSFRVVMVLAALAPVPFVVFCLVFAPVLLFGDRPVQATPEWKAMHVKVPLFFTLLLGLGYMGQVRYLWGVLLQEADLGWGGLVRVLALAAVLTALLLLRAPKRMRLGAGVFMGLLGLCLAVGLHYYVNAALCGPARHYPAVVVDSHAEDPEAEDDNYTLTVKLDNGEEAELVVLEAIYDRAMDGEALEVCHRESPLGVSLLDLHAPRGE